MLVRYRMLSTATLADMKSDIHKIISGQITSVSDFSSSCDKTNTVIYGSYPTGKYSVQDAGTYTYSKVHSQDASYTHYFRLIWGATGLDQIALAQSYTAGTNTLVNSTTSNVYRLLCGFSSTNNFGGTTFLASGTVLYDGYKVLCLGNTTQGNIAVGDSIRYLGDYMRINESNETNYYRTVRFERNTLVTSLITGTSNQYIYCLVNWDQMAAMKVNPQQTSTNAAYFNIYRGGNVSLTTTTYTAPTYSTIDIVINSKGIFFGSTNSKLALGIFDISKNGLSREFTSSALMSLVDLNNNNNGVQNPYSYNVSTSSYGVVSGAGLLYETPVRIPRANANLTIIENPISTSYRAGGFSTSTVYGVYKIADGTYNDGSRYTDGSGTSRIVYNNIAIVSE